ncbi:MAG: AIR synthase-related protein, partial [Cypionkella sp.]
TIGAVGLLTSLDDLIAGRPQAGDALVLIGATQAHLGGHLGQSALLAEAFGIETGDAPPVDLTAERAHGDFILSARKHIRACTDLSDGGLALAAFEMASGAGLGIALQSADIAQLYGEDQARYIIATSNAPALLAQAAAAGVPAAVVGEFGGDSVTFGGDSASLAELSHIYRSAFATALGLM